MFFRDQGRANAVNAAACLMQRGEPLTTTLIARLTALGVCIPTLEARYA